MMERSSFARNLGSVRPKLGRFSPIFD